MNIGEIVLVQKTINEIFSDSKYNEEVTIKTRHTFFWDLDNPNTFVETDDYVHLKIIKKDDENYIVEWTLRDETKRYLYNVNSSTIPEI